MKKVIRTMVFMIGILLLSYSGSYAAVIQIKDTTATVFTGETISDFYVIAEGLKENGQALDGTSVDVKMANNYEWSVVSYFSNSAYGTSGSGGNAGVGVKGIAKWYNSTNGNITGVMDWGTTYTYTAGIISNWKDDNGNIAITDETILSNGKSIINAAGTNKIDKFPYIPVNQDIAQTSWYGSNNNINKMINNPYSARKGLFGFIGGVPYSRNPINVASGKSYPDVTFRPIVWN